MSIKTLARRTGRTISKNSPAIFTALACGGVVSTVAFAIHATPKACLIVDQLKKEYTDAPVPKAELAKAVAPLYIPTGIMACVTIGCIIGANRISSKRNAILASLYSASEMAMKTYQEKVIEKIGEKKEREVRAEIASDCLRDHPIRDKEIIMTGAGQSLCYDTLSGRYFMSDYELIRQVQNTINTRIINDMWVTLNDVYYELGLKAIDLGEYIGWNVDRQLRFEFSSQIAEDGRPCLVISYDSLPIDRPDRL